MHKFFRTFFYQDYYIYKYNQSKQSVFEKIVEVLQRKVTFFGSNDMRGHFLSNDTFALNMASTTPKVFFKLGSTLIGQIIESPKDKGKTQIKTTFKPSYASYISFFLTLILGLVILVKYILTGIPVFLFLALALIIIGPALSVGLSNVAKASLYDRYIMYVDKELVPDHSKTDFN